ncbi:hypothetical protein [Actinomadura violacea]|uniref:Uncharacterized protein n=1 Tax=Actinomadura violacea TaxID=2819934 RepID=A0ABS3S0Z1_9ACTN|nr:hypothetical protein [Actinomadura violacea]MBO2462676.1 hypothetical protein [Actinomadura violacea]
MITSTVVSLRDAHTWNPAALMRDALNWPGKSPRTLPLRALATPLLTDGWVEKDVPVITPASLDPVGGGVRKRSHRYRGAVFQVRESERGLHPGDLLVPMLPDLPLLLLRPDHVGSLVSSAFLALRPQEGVGLWIWGVLTSRTGRSFRAHISTEAFGRATNKSALLDLEIPVLPPVKAGPICKRLEGIERRTHREEEEAAETWWRVADLSSGEWAPALATPNPQVLDAGIPLGDLCEEITRGRPVPREAYRTEPGPKLMSVTDIAVLGGKPARRWVPLHARPVVSKPGDVFVAAVGARPHAALATDTTAVDRNVFLLRLRNRANGFAIVHYLNGQAGYGLRQILLTGDFIPGMRKDHLARLPVPPEALDLTDNDGPPMPLDLELEHALWS